MLFYQYNILSKLLLPNLNEVFIVTGDEVFQCFTIKICDDMICIRTKCFSGKLSNAASIFSTIYSNASVYNYSTLANIVGNHVSRFAHIANRNTHFH
jgi:hypothetical protein